jgi:hypothetical protein
MQRVLKAFGLRELVCAAVANIDAQSAIGLRRRCIFPDLGTCRPWGLSHRSSVSVVFEGSVKQKTPSRMLIWNGILNIGFE